MTNPDWTCHNRVLGTVCILLVSGILVGGSFAVGADAQPTVNEKSAPVAETKTVAQTAPASSRLPDKTPAYLKQMPEPERVIADIRGSDELNTAARQVAALNRLIDVVITLSGTADAPGGPRLTTEEQNLNGRYAGAASSLLTTVYRSIDPDNKQQSDENSKRNQWNRLRDRYGDDEAFISALLQRYLTPDLKKQYLGHMRQTRQNIQALNQHIQAQQNIQALRQHIQAAAGHQNNVSIRQTDLPGFLSLPSADVEWGIGIGVLVLGVWWWRRDNDDRGQLAGWNPTTSKNSEPRMAEDKNKSRDQTSSTCANCHGSGRVKCYGFCDGGRRMCPVCSGRGGCSTCHHSGTIACSTCGGRGDIACSHCGGSGSIAAWM